MYVRPMTTTQFVVQLHTPDSTEWLSRHDTYEGAVEAALDWASQNGMAQDPDDDFISIITATTMTFTRVDETKELPDAAA